MRPCVVSASKSGAVSPSWSVMLRLRIRSRALRPASPPQIFGIRGPVSQSIGPKKNIILPLRASLSTAEYWDLACNRALAAAVAGTVEGIEQAAERASKSVQGGQNGDGNAGG